MINEIHERDLRLILNTIETTQIRCSKTTMILLTTIETPKP